MESVFETVVEEKEEESTLTSRFCSLLGSVPIFGKFLMHYVACFTMLMKVFFCP